VEACGHSLWFGYKSETCEFRSVLVTGVRDVSLWPLVTVDNLSPVTAAPVGFWSRPLGDEVLK
jgi:hypothetical protein